MRAAARPLPTLLFVGDPSWRGVPAFGGSVRVGAGNEHLFDFPPGFLRGDQLGLVTHLPTDTDGVHQRDNGTALSVLKGDSADVKWIVHVFRGARPQLHREHIGSDVDGGRAGVEAGRRRFFLGRGCRSKANEPGK